jgi:hypothetical protein
MRALVRNSLYVVAASSFAAMALAAAAEPARSSECTKIGICYCVSSEVKPAIEEKIGRFRALIAEQRKAGKSVGYLSVPLSPVGGGYFNLNAEVAEKAKQAIEKRCDGSECARRRQIGAGGRAAGFKAVRLRLDVLRPASATCRPRDWRRR